ncbi:hypothetical protein [Streptomyces sp. NPDC015345]|jgi:hypothetical protein|uniref:hypothetical protein n=1 Tax=Streptomyces sp. NPDC015345 TaxID=3364953 RepID=UPI0036F7F9D3
MRPTTPHGKRRAALAGAALSLALTAALAPAAAQANPSAPRSGSADATATCSLRQNQPHKDTLGNYFSLDLYCDNLASDAFGRPAFNAPVTGRLKFSPSWFVCWTEGDAAPDGNKIWYYTQSDEVVSLPGIKGWGMVPAKVVQTQKHPYPGLPRCPWF